MKKKMLLTAIIVALLTTVCFSQQAPAEKFVTALSKKKNTWLINKQYDSIKGLLDSRCLYIHSNGWVQNATEVLDDMKSDKLVYLSIDVNNTTARQYEKMVIVTGNGKFSGTNSGTPFSVSLVFTEVYVNRKSGWKLVTRHASKLPD
jgi:PBP1b-binding outer membrane lipoprotein LpoB